MIRLYAFPLSLNAERVAMALAHKSLEVEVVQVDRTDRSLVRRVSGQDLVPVIEGNGRTVFDSTEILRHLEAGHPDPPLFPRETARREEMDVFLDWFNGVWKRAPNLIFGEEQKPAPDRQAIAGWGREMARSLDRFEALLAGREHLLGDAFSAADCAAWPFVRYAIWSWSAYLLSDYYAVDGGWAALYSSAFDLGGAAGTIVAGHLSDRYFAGRRATLSFYLLIGMCLACGVLLAFGDASVVL